MERICGATFVFDHDGQPDLIGNELTGGSYRVMFGRAPAGEGPPMHVHPHTAEGFYIGEGEMTFVFPDREVVAGPRATSRSQRPSVGARLASTVVALAVAPRPATGRD